MKNVSSWHFVLFIGGIVLAGCGKNGLESDAVRIDASRLSSKISTNAEALTHFWFQYNGQPDPGRRIWIKLNEVTWGELYPNGSLSRYVSSDSILLNSNPGTIVRKVEGDPNQTYTPNDGSFEVYIPDTGATNAILFFRLRVAGDWSRWQPFTTVHPIR